MASAAAEPKKKKGFKLPPVLFLIMMVILVATIMTWIVPAGVFEKDPETGRLDPDSYHSVEQTPMGPWKLLNTIYPGYQGASNIIIVILYSGAAMNLLLASGALEGIIDFVLYKMQDKGVILGVPVLCFVMTVFGGLAAGDHFVAFMPVGLMIARKMRLDRICAVAIIYAATYVGFACSPTKMVMQAQMLADVPVMSGFWVRIAVWLTFGVIFAFYALRYALKISRDPSKSIMGANWQDELPEVSEADSVKAVKLDPRGLISLLGVFVVYALYAYGGSNWGWGYGQLIAELTVFFLGVGLLYRMSMATITKHFLQGAKNIANVCIIIGLARVISLVLESGNIIHTLVYWIMIPLSVLGKGMATVMIFLFNLFFNFLVTSGSGQAAIVMPLLVPLGDALGITRQVICSAFQYGDGLTNMLAPTSGVLMGFLGLAEVPFEKWIKFQVPIIVILAILAAAVVFVEGTIGWMG